MSDQRPTVLIGPIADDPAESVSGVNRAFMSGLKDEYRFIPSQTNRRFGSTRQSRFNAWNIYYLNRHLMTWVWNLALHRPNIAHYAINEGWALWKGILFLRTARRFGSRTVGHLHSGGFLDFWKRLPKAKRASALRQLNRFDAFVVLSDSWKAAAIDEIGVSPERIHVVNNPIDPGFEEAALSVAVERPQANFLGMGILSRAKGGPDLVAACAKLKSDGVQFHVHLAGPEREPGILDQVRAQVAEHGLEAHVSLPGLVRGAAKNELFRESSVSVLPSFYENFPLVLLEAAAAGHAIITTPVGAVPEFFSDGVSALFIEPGNVSQLASSMARLARNPKERARLAHAARDVFCRNLARPAIMRALDGTYRSVLGRAEKELRPETPADLTNDPRTPVAKPPTTRPHD